MDVRKYEPFSVEDGFCAYMTPSETGKWVSVADYDRLRAEVEVLRNVCETASEYIEVLLTCMDDCYEADKSDEGIDYYAALAAGRE